MKFLSSNLALRMFIQILLALKSVTLCQGNEFLPLGDLAGGTFSSQAFGVSADGSTVVGVSIGSSFDNELFEYPYAFRWTRSEEILGLGTLPGDSESYGFATSRDGSVIVGVSSFEDISNAFRWDVLNGMQELDSELSLLLPQALDVSSDGSVVIGLYSTPMGTGAYRWQIKDGEANSVALSSPLDVPNAIFANGVSADGVSVVGSASTEDGTLAFRWSETDGIEVLGDLLGGGTESVANAVSADGTVVVGTGTSENGAEAFRWTLETGMVGLGDLSGGPFFSFGNSVSDNGEVVVGYSISESDEGEPIESAFIWRDYTELLSLQEYLIRDTELAGRLMNWKLERATDVSADGKTIVGVGTNPRGHVEAWLVQLDLPGDYNNDDDLSIVDLDGLVVAISDNVGAIPAFDLDVNGMLDRDDLRIWIEELFETRFGDTDLDHNVSFADFLMLSRQYGQPGTWSQGDFDANGMVEFADFLMLANNFDRFGRGTITVPESIGLKLYMLLPLTVLLQRSRAWRNVALDISV